MAANQQLWLRFRHREIPPSPTRGSYWVENVARLGPAGWSPALELADSAGRLSVKGSILPAPDGGVLVAYSSDGRNQSHYNIPVWDKVRVAQIAGDASIVAPSPLTPYRDPATGDWDRHAEAEDVARIRGFRNTIHGRQHQILRGDLHRHTEFSWDGGPGPDGSLSDAYRYLIDVAALDFGAITDHQGGIHPYWWWLTQKSADMYHLPPRFVPLYGYERSVTYPHGHRNVPHAQRGVPVFPFQLKPEIRKRISPFAASAPEVVRDDTERLYESLLASDGIAIPHTPGTNMRTDWRSHDPAAEPVVEIYQGSRSSYEIIGGPRAYAGNSEPSPHGGLRTKGFVSAALSQGYRLGFIASSDHQSNHVSYAMVYAESNDRTSVMQALRRRSTYAATDNLILEAWADGHFMGEEYVTANPPTLQIRARGTGDIARVDLIHNGREILNHRPPRGSQAEVKFVHSDARPGLNHYYFRVVQADGEIAWGSPIWVRYEDPRP